MGNKWRGFLLEDIIYALIPIVFILAGASVLVLRPITKRLGTLLEQMQKDRQEARLEQSDLGQVRSMVESVHERLELIEQRQNFVEALVDSKQGSRELSGGPKNP